MAKRTRKKQNYDKEKASNLLKTANLLQTYETSNHAKYPIYAGTVGLRWEERCLFFICITHFGFDRCVNSEQRKQRHIKHGETNIPFYENDVANWRSEYFDSFSIYQHILSVFSLTPVLNVSHHLLFLRKH